MGIVKKLHNLHPRMTILSKLALEVSEYVVPTKSSILHWNEFLSTALNVPTSVRFEMPMQ